MESFAGQMVSDATRKAAKGRVFRWKAPLQGLLLLVLAVAGIWVSISVLRGYRDSGIGQG